jgi:hypothetical protein
MLAKIYDRAGEIAGQIRTVHDRISPSAQKRYRLPLLVRLARRVTVFSPECEVCQGLQVQIISIGSNLMRPPPMTRENLINYLNIIKSIVKHLKRKHGLAEEGQYVKRYMFIGLAIGLSTVVLGQVLLGFGITILTLNITVPALVTRVIFSYTIGYLLDRRARRRGKVL